jgi:3-dehydroquinate synthase
MNPTSVRITPPPAPAPGYEVVVRPGALVDLPALLRVAAPAHRYAVVSDSNVAPLWGEAVLGPLREAGLRADLVTVPAGESAKTRATWAHVLDEFLALGLGRDACVLALGGGVVGDLAGFAAATFLRGVSVVQIPTTLLAMVDASVGGKTGIDAPAGKNLIGAFHQPRLVLADPATLGTLPDRELRSGMAEVVKHGAIADERYFDDVVAGCADLLARKGGALTPVVRRSVEIKASFVAADPFEAGARKALNAGHTLGHAIEALSGYALAHGEAIAIGMVVEARAGERAGITAPGTSGRLEQALAGFGLPTRLPADMEPAAVLGAARSDKKARAGRLHYTLLERIGGLARAADGAWTHALDDELVAAALAECRERTPVDGVFPGRGSV